MFHAISAKRALLSAAAFCFMSTFTSAQEWSRFLGSSGGVSMASEAIPTDLSEKSIRWSVDLPGPGISSPVLWGTQLFLTAESGKEGQRQVLCFDATTGKQLWTVVEPFKPHGQHKFNNFASSTPACDAKHVYIAWTNGDNMHVVALKHDGKPAWQKDLGHYHEEHGSGASPVVVGDVLLVSNDFEGEGACLLGLETATGKEKWRLARKTARTPFSTPVIVPREDAPGKVQAIYSSNPEALTSIDPETGKILWSQAYGAPSKLRAVGSPCYEAGVFLATVGQGGGGQAFVATKLVDGKPQPAWEEAKGLPYVPTPVGRNGHFYVLNDGGNLSCLKAETGEAVYKERLFNNAYSSPVIAGDRMLCISRGGEMAVVQIGEKFQKIAEGTLNEPCDATPAIANGMVFVRTVKRLVAMGGAVKKKLAE